jgi:hypothetical protein
MRYTTFHLVLLAGLAVASPDRHAAAQEARDRVERIQDRQDLRQDARQIRDDARDLDRIQQLTSSFDAARKNRDFRRLREIDSQVQRLLVDELAESSRELQQKQREVRQDRRELRSARREVREDRQMQAGIVPRLDDQHDRRDDRRDLRDDRRDLQAEQAQQDAYATIARDWTQLMDREDAASLARKRELLVALQAVARGELRSDASERREDRRELREDRRETAEDRWQDRR